MFCIVSLIIFSVLGLFSATHRQFAKEAFDCVFRRVTFRPCNTGFREKVKGIILVKLMRRSEFSARVFNKHFEFLAWVFFVLMLVSSFYVARGGYNYYLYGNCNGANEDGFCLFDPTGENNKVSPVEDSCNAVEPSIDSLNVDNLDLGRLYHINNNSENNVVFIGCYVCDFTRKAYPDLMKLLEKKKPNFYFGHLPVNHQSDYLSQYDYCAQTSLSGDYLKYMDLMFLSKPENLSDNLYLHSTIKKAGYEIDEIEKCLIDINLEKNIQKNIDNIGGTNIYGTPLVFINGEPLTGPKPYRVYRGYLK